MEFLTDYGLFLAKAVTVVAALLVVIGGIVALSQRRHKDTDGHIEVTDLCARYEDFEEDLKSAILDEDDYKALHKAERREEKRERKQRRKHKDAEPPAKRIFVLDFDGDIRASAVDNLREEISAVLTQAQPEHDQVLLRLDSGGGMVHSYGLAASQLQRLVNANLQLTVAVDQVAASGGYMMACIAQKIIAAPFAIIGSIGVMAQLPNFHRLLKKHEIDVELHTAGEFKRTLTMFGENTEKGRRKFLEELEDTHTLFKEFVARHRAQVEIDTIATGEVWYGMQALERGLVDAVRTSDEFLMEHRKDNQLFLVKYVQKKNWQEKLGLAAEASFDRVLANWLNRLTSRWFL